MLARMKVPIVLIDNQHPGESVHSVMIDNIPASRHATQHLIDLGHRRIADLGDQFGFQSDTDRFSGYRQALQRADLPFLPELVVHGNGSADGGIRAMNALLALKQRPSAVFCYNDMSALGALRAVYDNGLRVPEDVSLVGFDDLPIASYMFPRLTTVRQPKEQMGRMATESLLKILDGTSAKTNFDVEGELIVRDSSGPPRR
jgi:DNA-binding LacI/PurR family transcriptional regulator